MIKSAIANMRTLFPHVTRVELDDSSTFLCDGVQTSLAHYSVALHGATWYERNFSARLKDAIVRARYADAIRTLTDPEKMAPFAAHSELVQHENSKLLQKIYETSLSYVEFFQTLRSEHIERFCDLMRGWMQPFVDALLGENHLNARWVIEDLNRLRIKTDLIEEPATTTMHGGSGSRQQRPQKQRHLLVTRLQDV
jgi:hypothetical protein